MLHNNNGGYENVEEYISIGTPNVNTLAKLDALEPTKARGDRKSFRLFFDVPTHGH